MAVSVGTDDSLPKRGRPRLIDRDPSRDTILEDIEQCQLAVFSFSEQLEDLVSSQRDEAIYTRGVLISRCLRQVERALEYYQYQTQVALGVVEPVPATTKSEAVRRGHRDANLRRQSLIYKPSNARSREEALTLYNEQLSAFYSYAVQCVDNLVRNHTAGNYGQTARDNMQEIDQHLKRIYRYLSR